MKFHPYYKKGKPNNKTYKMALFDFVAITDEAPFYFPDLVINDREDEDDKNKGLKFHANSNDYFGTLATVLDLLRQEEEKVIAEVKKKMDNHGRKFKKLKNDLQYLQKNYKITKK